jgi:hypothetical protein
MTWQTVEANINWSPSVMWGTLPDYGGPLSLIDQEFVLTYLNQMYISSRAAAGLLESGTTGGGQIRLYRSATRPGIVGSLSSGIAGLNLTAIDNHTSVVLG